MKPQQVNYTNILINFKIFFFKLTLIINTNINFIFFKYFLYFNYMKNLQ